MRLVVDQHHQYAAEHVCHSARDGQRILNEYPITTLFLGHTLRGRGSALDLLKWAKQKHRMPAHITLVTNHHNHRQTLGQFLRTNGYTGDGIFFHRVKAPIV